MRILLFQKEVKLVVEEIIDEVEHRDAQRLKEETELRLVKEREELQLQEQKLREEEEKQNEEEVLNRMLNKPPQETKPSKKSLAPSPSNWDKKPKGMKHS